ncbi:MAG: hypothetical protein EAZ92_02345 [Candidatus Kapaibacterium sp.]|nr:MAG: hypothetical protein EAZ92_02345 [Candidatus Kapabacteria bacterium]
MSILCKNLTDVTMKEPSLSNHPTEIFGFPFTDSTSPAKNALMQQYCPFLDGECKKPRKSEPHIKVGICSAGYKGSFLAKPQPVVLCPHRFETNAIFQTIREEYFSTAESVLWAKEVSLGVGGSVDFVAVEIQNGVVQDFLCVEFQAAGTTGTPWQAVVDLKQHGKFLQESYPYGINWANEFAKTMMQQVYKKGKIITSWKRKIVFVFQDVGLDYLRSACDVSGLRPAQDADPIHFCTFKLVWKHRKWVFALSEKVSTDVDGINKILGGALSESYPSPDDFIANISRKLEL